MIYFTSDLHLGHKNIIKLIDRPFVNVEEMNETFIHHWNQKIQNNDTVYILGDFTFKMNVLEAHNIIKQLHGHKILIKGNHDKNIDVSLFDEVCDFKIIKYHKQKFILMHYPLLEWPHYFQGGIHLHGHQHNHRDYNELMRSKGIRRYDVGVDANEFYPVSIDEIIDFMEGSNESNKL